MVAVKEFGQGMVTDESPQKAALVFLSLNLAEGRLSVWWGGQGAVFRDTLSHQLLQHLFIVGPQPLKGRDLLYPSGRI